MINWTNFKLDEFLHLYMSICPPCRSKVRNFLAPRNLLHGLSQSIPTPLFPHHYSVFRYHWWVLPVLEHNRNEIVQYFLCAWLHLCIIVSVKGIHVVACSNSFFLKFLCSVLFCEYTPIDLSILQMMDIWVVSSVWVLRTKQLW